MPETLKGEEVAGHPLGSSSLSQGQFLYSRLPQLSLQKCTNTTSILCARGKTWINRSNRRMKERGKKDFIKPICFKDALKTCTNTPASSAPGRNRANISPLKERAEKERHYSFRAGLPG